MATRLKLVTDPDTGIAAWYVRSTGDLFVQCSLLPVSETFDFCAPAPEIPTLVRECGIEVEVFPGVSSDSSWVDSSDDDGGGGDGSSDESSSDGSSSSFSSSSYSSSFSSSSNSISLSSCGSISSSYSVSDCLCLVDPLYDFGWDLHTIGRTYRTVSTFDAGGALAGLENDDEWVLVPELGSPGAATGGVYFNVCSVSEITIRLYFAPSSATYYVTIFVNGTDLLDEALGVIISPGAGEFHDYIVPLTGCVNAIYVSGIAVGFTDQVFMEIVNVL